MRISTTVEVGKLERARRLLPGPDSRLIDRALDALSGQLEAERELEALLAHPYEDDPELAWQAPPGPDLPYEGAIPPEVIRLAEQSRRRRR
jgi:hypothetical protein